MVFFAAGFLAADFATGFLDADFAGFAIGFFIGAILLSPRI